MLICHEAANKMNYRREIDGLRALAVLPVILFHAGFQTFSGGFVGVDVFFVISGYLITTIILTEKQAGTFTLINFYERRARRILPALFTVMLVCLPFAWIWLLPQDMKNFSDSLVAVSGFASNILFWRTSGYFEPAAELKPLLHTWSLAVEEQYYVFFPLFLMLTWHLGRRWILVLLTLVAAASLAAAQWGSVANPDANFYLLPTRDWELLIGAFDAFYFASGDRPHISDTAGQFGSITGLAMLAYATFAFDKQTPFPSLYTLVPTIGAALIILFATQRTWVGQLLGNKFFVGIGLISYSAYLWHQPLFAFARQSSIFEPNQLLFGMLSAASIVLAYFSWKYIENPFRNKRQFSRRQIFLFGAMGSAFFIGFGLIGHFNKGFENRIGQEQKAFLASFDNELPEWKYFMRTGIPQKYRNECNFFDIPKYRAGTPSQIPVDTIAPYCYTREIGKKAVFIWGDSHAQQLYYGLKQVLPTDWQILQVASSGCVATTHATENRQDYCEYANWFAFQKIAQTRPDIVIVGQNLGHNPRDMQEVSARLLAAGVGKVVFTGPNPHWSTDLPKVVAHKLMPDTPRRTFIGADRSVMHLDETLKSQVEQSAAVRYVSIVDYFCNGSGCLVYIGDDLKNGITSWDYGHLSPIASYHFAKDVLSKAVLD